MQYLVVFQPRASFKTEGKPSDYAEVEQAEQVQSKALYKQGVARQIWGLETERKGAAAIFEAPSDADLQRAVESFPMVQKTYVDYQVFPLGPFGAFAQ